VTTVSSRAPFASPPLSKINRVADVSVRAASPDDAPAVAAVQAESWKKTFAGTLPPAVLDLLPGAQAAEQWREEQGA